RLLSGALIRRPAECRDPRRRRVRRDAVLQANTAVALDLPDRRHARAHVGGRVGLEIGRHAALAGMRSLSSAAASFSVTLHTLEASFGCLAPLFARSVDARQAVVAR